MNILWLIFQAIASLLSVFIPLDRNKIVFNSTNNQNYNFNSKFLFEYYRDKSNSDLNVFFVINNKDKQKLLAKEGVNNIISSNSFYGIFLCLTAKIWICSTIEAPIFSLVRRRGRIVYHLGHGIPLKNIGLAEKKISFTKKINRHLRLRLFTHITSYSELFVPVLKKAFKNENAEYVMLGQPRNDFLLEGEHILSDIDCLVNTGASKRILYSPTWRSYAETKFFPFSDMDKKKLHAFLEATNTIIYLRPHPYFKASIDNDIYGSTRVKYFGSDVISDVTPYLNFFDILITDYSSIFLDFYALDGKLVIFLPYDLDIYDDIVGFSVPYATLAAGEIVDSLSGLIKCIDASLFTGGDDYSDIRCQLNIKSSGNCLEHYSKIECLRNE